jgi:hypothetical protein
MVEKDAAERFGQVPNVSEYWRWALVTAVPVNNRLMLDTPMILAREETEVATACMVGVELLFTNHQ